MTDEEMIEVARAAAVAEARERGWLGPNEAAPPDSPVTGQSFLIAMLARPHLRRLRGAPNIWAELAAEERDAEARKKAERRARGDRILAKMAGRG